MLYAATITGVSASKKDAHTRPSMVPRAGLEPARANAQEILSLSCLPIPSPRQKRYIFIVTDQS